MSNKLSTILAGVLFIALGVIIAVSGGGTALNVYIGIVSIVAGVALLVFACIAVAKKLPLPIGGVLLAGILITIAIAIFMEKLSFAALIGVLIFALMGLGFGLVVVGLYTIVRHSLIYGLGQIVLGALFVLFTALFLGIPDFAKAFWIIIGIMVIVYGVLVLVSAFVGPKKLKK